MRLFLAASYPEAVGGIKSISSVLPGGLGRQSQSSKSICVGDDTMGNDAERERERDVQLRILLSYWYYKDVDLDKLFAKYFTEPYPDVFADSGAFSAMSQKAQVNIDKYAAWIKRYKHLFSIYANLDVIGNPEATLKNQRILEDIYGLQPLPVVHASKDYKPLEDYLKDGYAYIALGGLVPYAAQPKVRMRYLIGAFKLAGNDAVFHGFGVTSWEVMSQLRWYSVDSSSWGSGFRFGTIPLFDSQRGRFEKAKLGDAPGCLKLSRLFEDLGFNWQDFADRKRNDRAKICAISALSYIKAEQYLRRKFGEVYIPNKDASAVLRTHLADANPQRFGEAASGLRLHLSDTSNGVNYGDASAVLRLHLAERDPQHHSWADNGIKTYIAAGQNSENSNSGNPAIAESGIKLHLADARSHTAADKSAAQSGIKVHLADTTVGTGG